VVWEAYLRGLGLFQPIYGVALEEACELRAELIECRQEIAENGRWYTTTNKAGDVMRRPHPAQGQLADSQRRLVPFLSEFGLTPVGRAKLLAMKVDEHDSHSDPSEAFFGK
jgi:P27 family predicted phage terminase small subunit